MSEIFSLLLLIPNCCIAAALGVVAVFHMFITLRPRPWGDNMDEFCEWIMFAYTVYTAIMMSDDENP